MIRKAILTLLASVGCAKEEPAPVVGTISDASRTPPMHELRLDCKRGQFILSIMAPAAGLPPIDDCREVRLTVPESGRYRAVLFLLPDTESDDTNAAMPIANWTVPARWDDNTMLYVPSFEPNHILAAFAHVLDNNLENEAFEHENDVDF